MVVTIEPGLYFIPSLLDPLIEGELGQFLNLELIDRLRGCGGTRIEDNVVVTDAGRRNLTREQTTD
jgi:Xaa-Pro dipeptidase